jgi:hypothetical protein
MRGSKEILLVLVLMFSISFVAAAESVCDLDVTLLNQDPYPAVPGDYVKVVFQISGITSRCDDITFNLLQDYPIGFDPGQSGFRVFRKVDYIKDFESNILVPYEVRVDEDAIDGTNPIEVRVQSRNSAALTKTFDLEVENSLADFEVYVKNYDYATRELTIEVLNIADVDIEALTIEIPKQDGVEVKGSRRIVVGDLDSNEYTSADFEARPEDGEITLNLIYSDSINVRRTAEKTIEFDSSYFTNRASDQTSSGFGQYIFIGAVVLVVLWITIKKIRKARKNYF